VAGAMDSAVVVVVGAAAAEGNAVVPYPDNP
jgi:hypothetical protein